MAALRASDDPRLRDASILVRPHPANPQDWDAVAVEEDGRTVVWQSFVDMQNPGSPPLDLTQVWSLHIASGQVDCATDFDRNRNAMIEGGKLEKNATEVVWTSEPLPNDAIAVPRDFDPALADRIQKILVGITDAQAKTILPNHYTGFVAATHESYRMIEDAGVLVGRLKKK